MEEQKYKAQIVLIADNNLKRVQIFNQIKSIIKCKTN
jgi:hypothetical protein